MRLFKFFKQVFQEFGKDKAGQLSAAFAYGAIFAIGPLLLVLISVIGIVYGEQAAQGKLFTELSGTVGASTAKTIQDAVARTHQAGGGLAFVLGILGMLLAAAGITTQLQNSFNTILGVVPDPRGGIKRTVYVKLKNILLIIIAGITVIASLVASTIIIHVGEETQKNLGIPPITLEFLNNVISLLVFVPILYLLYRVLPDLQIPRKLVWKTAFIVSLLFLIGKLVLGIIIGNNGTASAYGAAAGLITLLLWIYYSSQILLIGAEGIKVYGLNHSLAYRPKKFNLKRTTVHVDSDAFKGRVVEAWARGFNKKSSK